MTATLEERLSYLVNYSSQLIFVSGNSLKDQTHALEEILFHQSEKTELAYLVADDSFQITDYRRLLCQQLLGHTPFNFSRPLNECLAALNHREGPILVAITRADKMTNDVLQELWELVLQSRFAGNKQHLNVILFGESSWANQAKQWLPANNTSTPLLLSSQKTSFQPDLSHESFKAKALVAENAQEQLIEQRPLLSQGAFWAAILVVGLCIVLASSTQFFAEQKATLFAPLSSQDAKLDSKKIDTVLKWDQVKTLVPETSLSEQFTEESVVELDPLTEETIVEIEQVNIVDEINSAEKAAITAENKTDDVIVDSENSKFIPYSQKPNSDVTEFDPNHYFVQIAGLKDKNLLDRFRREHKIEKETLFYETYRYGGPWYVVLIKTPFTTLNEAKQLISSEPLPAYLRDAFVKKGASIHKELSIVVTQDKLAQAL